MIMSLFGELGSLATKYADAYVTEALDRAAQTDSNIAVVQAEYERAKQAHAAGMSEADWISYGIEVGLNYVVPGLGTLVNAVLPSDVWKKHAMADKKRLNPAQQTLLELAQGSVGFPPRFQDTLAKAAVADYHRYPVPATLAGQQAHARSLYKLWRLVNRLCACYQLETTQLYVSRERADRMLHKIWREYNAVADLCGYPKLKSGKKMNARIKALWSAPLSIDGLVATYG